MTRRANASSRSAAYLRRRTEQHHGRTRVEAVARTQWVSFGPLTCIRSAPPVQEVQKFGWLASHHDDVLALMGGAHRHDVGSEQTLPSQ